MGLTVGEEKPLIAVISRLADQKGIDLIAGIIEDVLNYSDAELVVLGKGEYRYEEFFSRLGNNRPKQVKALMMYNKELAKKIYAAADIFLMPSYSEPCGLSQMIASRYGAVPVTRGNPAAFTTPSKAIMNSTAKSTETALRSAITICMS